MRCETRERQPQTFVETLVHLVRVIGLLMEFEYPRVTHVGEVVTEVVTA